MKARKKVIQGGTSAGKTYAIIPILIDKALKESRLKITVVAETLPAVRDGAIDIFMNTMHDTNRWDDSCWRESPQFVYTFKRTKSRIQFKSFDSVGKSKSAGKRDVLFLNEANNIPFDIADALMIRSKETYIDFNPDAEFWAHTEVLKEPNSEFLLLTYEDNEALPPETLEDLLIKKEKAFFDVNAKDLFAESNIKNNYWANWWKVYGLGMTGSLSGTVFNNWSKIDNLPPDAELLAYGLDWGYSQDPTCLISMYKWNGKLIIDELIYRKGLINSELANIMRTLNLNMRVNIVADSAEPKSIADLKMYGFYNVVPAVKGADSVRNGINKLQEHDILITSRSSNTINEFQNYTWAKDRNGKETGEPIDAFNHAIDPARYVALTKLSYQGYTEVY